MLPFAWTRRTRRTLSHPLAVGLLGGLVATGLFYTWDTRELVSNVTKTILIVMVFPAVVGLVVGRRRTFAASIIAGVLVVFVVASAYSGALLLGDVGLLSPGHEGQPWGLGSHVLVYFFGLMGGAPAAVSAALGSTIGRRISPDLRSRPA